MILEEYFQKSLFFEKYYKKIYDLIDIDERGILDWACVNFLKNDKNVIDIGAHIGWYTKVLYKLILLTSIDKMKSL